MRRLTPPDRIPALPHSGNCGVDRTKRCSKSLRVCWHGIATMCSMHARPRLGGPSWRTRCASAQAPGAAPTTSSLRLSASRPCPCRRYDTAASGLRRRCYHTLLCTHARTPSYRLVINLHTRTVCRWPTMRWRRFARLALPRLDSRQHSSTTPGARRRQGSIFQASYRRLPASTRLCPPSDHLRGRRSAPRQPQSAGRAMSQ